MGKSQKNKVKKKQTIKVNEKVVDNKNKKKNKK